MQQRIIKFRQPIFYNNGEFKEFHYWGLMSEGCNVSPLDNGRQSQQLIGLKDKNGVQIWEGDILKSAGGNVKVEWFFNRWIFRNTKGRKEEILREYHYFFEVIGNKWENPDLIK